ncbi:MAG: TonB-dependent receptor [Pseudomonadota bacterium]
MTLTENNWGKSVLLGMASCLALSAAAGTATAQTTQSETSVQQVDIIAGPLGNSINAITRAFGVNVLASEDLVEGRRAPAITGAISVEAALDRALTGSGLTYSLTGGAFIVTQQVAPAPVEAAPDNPDATVILVDEAEPTVQDTVIVTGTRIERTAANAPAPVDIVTAEDIEAFGLTDNTEALRFVPALQQSQSLSSFNEFTSGARDQYGISALDLRGLGSARTLVLVNGRRHVAGFAGEATVDVSSIPVALIDRVEVLTGGGSSIYGADAVSGVVNYVLKDNFEGLDVRGDYSLPTRGDGEAYFGALTAGANFAEDRGNVVLSVEYNRQTPIRTDERDTFVTGGAAILRRNNADIAQALGVDPEFTNVLIPGGVFPINPPFPSIGLTFNGGLIPALIAGPGETNGVTNFQRFDRVTGELRPFDFGVRADNFASLGGDGSNIPINPSAYLIPDIERFSLNGLASYDFTEELSGFLEVKYSNSQTEAPDVNSILLRDVPITRDNPFLPTELAAQYDSLTAQGLDPVLRATLRPDLLPLGIISENNRETFRIVGGFKGEFSPAFAYEVSANYGRTNTEVIDANGFLQDRFFAGVDAVTDPNGNIVCRSDLDPNAEIPFGLFAPPLSSGFTTFQPGDGSCTPINIFEPFTSEQVDFFSSPFRSTFDIDQFVLNGTVTGNSAEFFKSPGGGIGYAIGFEYREEESQFIPDELEAAGFGNFAFFGQIPEALGGEFDVTEGFAEVNVPILADTPFAKRLDVDASIRIADYSTVGSTTSWAVGGLWQPVDDLRLRASFNRAVRAPNINELFTPQSVFVDSSINDPCSADRLNDGSEFRAANCAQLVPPGFVGGFGNVPDVAITRGGNPNLEEETADTFTIGFVYEPSFLPGLTLIADYYDIEIEDAIVQGTSEDSIFNNCVDAPDINNPACAAITRNPTTGFIETTQATALNFAALRTEGIDYQANYAFDLEDFLGENSGDFNASIAGNYLIDREDQAFGSIESSNESRLGEAGGFGIPAFPRHFINFNLNWEKGPYQIDYGVNYQSSTTYFFEFLGIDREAAEADPFLANQSGTGDSFVHFLGGSYEILDDVLLSVRVNNLFDRDPFVRGTNSTRIRPTSAIGRTVQLGVRARF